MKKRIFEVLPRSFKKVITWIYKSSFPLHNYCSDEYVSFGNGLFNSFNAVFQIKITNCFTIKQKAAVTI